MTITLNHRCPNLIRQYYRFKRANHKFTHPENPSKRELPETQYRLAYWGPRHLTSLGTQTNSHCMCIIPYIPLFSWDGRCPIHQDSFALMEGQEISGQSTSMPRVQHTIGETTREQPTCPRVTSMMSASEKEHLFVVVRCFSNKTNLAPLEKILR